MYDIDNRRHASAEEALDFTDCGPCGTHIERSAGYCCQGAVPDQCRTILCETCADDRKCLSCTLAVCDKHARDFCGERWCDDCIKQVAKEGAEILAEYEFTEQDTACHWVTMAAAGCTLESMRDTGRAL